MSEYFYIEKDNAKFLETSNNMNIDLYLTYCGSHICSPSHSFGPCIRTEYLIHYILDGKGVFEANGKKYNLKKNQGFLIVPNEVTYYEADKYEPWRYIWVSFNGAKASEYLKYINFTLDNLIFDCRYSSELESCVSDMLNLKGVSYSEELKAQSLLYLFLSILLRDCKNKRTSTNSFKETYIKKSIEFIQNNYYQSIKIADIANYVGLNRSYLYTLFKESLGLSPQEFLLKYRISKASELLTSTNLPISTISNSVGYYDSLTFSKIFKKHLGLSPKQYRIRYINKKINT